MRAVIFDLDGTLVDTVYGHALAWQRYEDAIARYPESQSLRVAREDCGMRWLREIRVREGKETFTDIVNRVLPVLAEGVETKDQLAFLAKESCDEIQGFLVGRPKPIEDYAELTGVPQTVESKKAMAGAAAS